MDSLRLLQFRYRQRAGDTKGAKVNLTEALAQKMIEASAAYRNGEISEEQANEIIAGHVEILQSATVWTEALVPDNEDSYTEYMNGRR